jgi:hypothetical protein
MLVLALAVLQNAPPAAVAACSAYYLVGALAGLFKRLQAESTNDAATEDYNSAAARVWRTPVLSGLAGVGGVLVIAMLPALTPQSTPATAVVPTPTLSQVFDLNANAHLLVLAAAFGLTPGLLTGRLQEIGEQYKGNLQSTNPT